MWFLLSGVILPVSLTSFYGTHFSACPVGFLREELDSPLGSQNARGGDAGNPSKERLGHPFGQGEFSDKFTELTLSVGRGDQQLLDDPGVT